MLLAHPLREMVTVDGPYPAYADRPRALFSSWYEFFPRSEGAYRDAKTGTVVSGTFATAAKRLEAVAAMGFDVIYLPPIHPIGEVNRKGPNNTLTPGPGRPGLAVGDRQPPRWTRRRPSRPRHPGRLRRVRGQRRQRSGSRSRSTSLCSAPRTTPG